MQVCLAEEIQHSWKSLPHWWHYVCCLTLWRRLYDILTSWENIIRKFTLTGKKNLYILPAKCITGPLLAIPDIIDLILYQTKTSWLVQHTISWEVCFKDFLTNKVQTEGKREREGGGNLPTRIRFWWHWCMVDYLLSWHNICTENTIFLSHILEFFKWFTSWHHSHNKNELYHTVFCTYGWPFSHHYAFVQRNHQQT